MESLAWAGAGIVISLVAGLVVVGFRLTSLVKSLSLTLVEMAQTSHMAGVVARRPTRELVDLFDDPPLQRELDADRPIHEQKLTPTPSPKNFWKKVDPPNPRAE